jgi:regulator of nucleoside diphosphate kinase
MPRQIFITENDWNRLGELISNALREGLQSDKSFDKLKSEIAKAKIVDSKQLPPDIVTMNSKILVEIDGNEEEIALVYPEDADLIENKISVLSPIGTAILGYGEGDRIEWEIPSGVTEIHIKKVLYQPESVGDYHL